MTHTPGLDYYFDQMLDDYLEEYFEDRENAWEGLEEWYERAEDKAYADDDDDEKEMLDD